MTHAGDGDRGATRLARFARLARRCRLLVGLLLSFAAISPAFARDDLVIGISQFPAMLHPSIDSMNAKTYVLGFTRRPLTALRPLRGPAG